MRKLRLGLIVAVLVAGFTGIANAQEKGPDDWKFTLGIYLWGTGLEGTSQIGPVTAPINITFSDALDNLSTVLTLHFEAQRGKWGFLADAMHIGLDPSSTLPNGAQLNLDITNNIFELGGIYSATETIDVLFGVRVSEFELEGSIPPALSGTIADETWTDGFVGGRAVFPFAKNWRFRVRGDIGAGDSDFVWNAILAVDYRFNNTVSGFLGYRWLDYDYDNGEAGPNRFTYDIRYEGPLGAVVFHW